MRKQIKQGTAKVQTKEKSQQLIWSASLLFPTLNIPHMHILHLKTIQFYLRTFQFFINILLYCNVSQIRSDSLQSPALFRPELSGVNVLYLDKNLVSHQLKFFFKNYFFIFKNMLSFLNNTFLENKLYH